MAQISSNVLAYQQIYERLRSFFLRDSRKEFESNQQRLEEYNAILSDLHYSISAPSAKYIPYIKGEPPSSEKINKFTQALALDIRNISSQSDFLSAKVINAFNMFALEVENEKSYLDRIGSKAKILQMYNRSESEDLVYFGDSFENMDFMDIAKIKQGNIPLVRNGFATFPVSKSSAKNISSIQVLNGNGFAGNAHQVIDDLSEEGESDYKFVGISSPFIGNAKSISDANPLTYFEYEALSIDKSIFTGDNIPSENEFKYVATSSYSEDVEPGSLVDWSSFSYEDDGPLTCTVSLSGNSSSIMNSLDIVPYFKSQKMLTVSSIKVYGRDGVYEEILSESIYIGSSMSPLNIDIARNYFYNKANVKFSERIVSKIDITFEQNDFYDINILHSYWKPNYDEGAGEGSPFKDLSRFNPDSLTGYSLIEYNQKSLIPKIDDPFYFKKNDNMYMSQLVSLKKEEYNDNFYAIKFTDVTSGIDFYFSSFDNFDPEQDSYPQNIVFSDKIETYASADNLSTRRYPTEEEGQIDLDNLIQFFENVGTLISGTQYELATDILFSQGNEPSGVDPNTVVIDTSDVRIELDSILVNPPEEKYLVPLSRESVVLAAKRFTIGIRDISLHYEEYDSSMEIVSKPFVFPSELETIMVDVDMSIDPVHVNDISINYYISVEDGKWIEISPISLSFSGIPEVVSFNSRTPTSQQISGVSYFNHPDVPSVVDSLRFKITAAKSKNINISPKINSYQIIGKVKL